MPGTVSSSRHYRAYRNIIASRATRPPETTEYALLNPAREASPVNVALAAETAAVAVLFNRVLLSAFEVVTIAIVLSFMLDVGIVVNGLVEVVKTFTVLVGISMAASVSDDVLIVVVASRTLLTVVVLILMLDYLNTLAYVILSGRQGQTYSLDQCLRDELGDGLGAYRSSCKSLQFCDGGNLG